MFVIKIELSPENADFNKKLFPDLEVTRPRLGKKAIFVRLQCCLRVRERVECRVISKQRYNEMI